MPGRILLLLLCLYLLGTVELRAQDSDTEYWVGYISSIQVSEKFSLWNDFHFLPTAFWVNRHGLTWHFARNHALTGGYAYVTTATGFSDRLIRPEHRPWAQFEVLGPFGERMGWRVRLRYDRRIRRDLSAPDVLDTYTAYNRWRLMVSGRVVLHRFENGSKLQFNLMNEILLNQGKDYLGNLLDQNRTYVMLGYDLAKIRFLCGYHIRAIPINEGDYRIRQGVTLWVIHRYNATRYPAP